MVSYLLPFSQASKKHSLNPYCSGRWSRTYIYCCNRTKRTKVLILIVVDDGLVPLRTQMTGRTKEVVLILIVVDDGLVLSV